MIKRATKWLCASIAIVMVSSASVWAQPLIPDFNVGSKVRGGIKVGASFTTLTGDAVVLGNELEGKTGFTVGAFLNIDIPVLPFELQPELSFIQKGAGVENSDVSIQFDYFEVPLFLKFPVAKNSRTLKPSFLIGPYFGFNTRADFNNGFVDSDIADSVRDTEFGVALGAELQVGDLLFGARYTAALTDAFESNITGFSDEKNMALSVFVGFKFF